MECRYGIDDIVCDDRIGYDTERRTTSRDLIPATLNPYSSLASIFYRVADDLRPHRRRRGQIGVHAGIKNTIRASYDAHIAIILSIGDVRTSAPLIIARILQLNDPTVRRYNIR